MPNQRDLEAFLNALQSGTGSTPAGARAAMCTLVANSGKEVKLHDFLLGLAEGYDDQFAESALCKVVGYACKYLTPTGALIVIVIGVLKSLQLIKSAATSVKNLAWGIIAAMEGISDPASAVTGGMSWVTHLFAPSSSDASSDATIAVIGSAITAAIPIPIAAVISQFGGVSSQLPASAINPLGGGGGAPSSPAATPAATAATDDLSTAITQGILAALGTTDAKFDRLAIARDVSKLLRRGASPKETHDTMMSRLGRPGR